MSRVISREYNDQIFNAPPLNVKIRLNVAHARVRAYPLELCMCACVRAYACMCMRVIGRVFVRACVCMHICIRACVRVIGSVHAYEHNNALSSLCTLTRRSDVTTGLSAPPPVLVFRPPLPPPPQVYVLKIFLHISLPKLHVEVKQLISSPNNT